ncbi:MAG: hypothetical protein COA78_25320 [Blastopirellula sp.]|nr:MAG: hypothetical protein COA78_25320 [Blastopirellula sp.]
MAGLTKKIGLGLQAFAAGARGKGTEFLAGQDAISDERKKAQLMAGRVALNAINNNNIDFAITGLTDRAVELNEGGRNTDFTMGVLNLLKSGDPEALTEARRILSAADQEAVIQGVLEPVSQGEDFTLSSGATRFGAGGNVIADNPVAAGSAQAPSAVREFEFFDQLSPEDQEVFLQVKRANPSIDLGATTIIPSQLNPGGEPLATFTEELSPSDQPENIAAAATARDTAEGRVSLAFEAGGARNIADAVVTQSENLVSSIDSILSHPGLAATTGLSSALDPRNIVPGTDASDAKILISQLKDRIFVDSINAMRAASKTGGAVGAVSDTEGSRLENMMGSLNRGQSDEQFLEQLNLIKTTATEMIKRTNSAFSREFEGFSGSGDPELDAILQAIKEQ